MSDTSTGPPPFLLSQAGVELSGDPVLTDVSLDVAPGSFLAILGQNGSGKSTLLRAMLGLLPLASGSLRIYGQPAHKFREWRRIAYVPQHLLSAGAVPVSVQEAVAAALISPATRLSFRSPRGAVRMALTEVGLWERRKDSLHTLSGGQQRRVLIAAALAKQADTLVLDEPTAGVDAENVAHLVSLLADLKHRGVTVIVVTHELGDLAGLVTHCVVLGAGGESSVLYNGPPPGPRSLADPHAHHDEGPPESIWGLPT